jgi:hypothetical protein
MNKAMAHVRDLKCGSPMNCSKSRLWTKDDDCKLQQLVQNGASKYEIAAELRRTPGAVISRATTLGVSLRRVHWIRFCPAS